MTSIVTKVGGFESERTGTSTVCFKSRLKIRSLFSSVVSFGTFGANTELSERGVIGNDPILKTNSSYRLLGPV